MSVSKRIYPTPEGAPAAAPSRLRQIKAAAHESGLSERFVRRLVEERRIPSYKVGRHRLVDLDDVDRYVVAGYTPAGGAA